MPSLDDETIDSRLKMLLLGDSKAGKTHYTMKAAEAGFNILYLDADVAIQTLKKPQADGGLSPAARKRIKYLQVGDYVDDKGRTVNRFAEFWKDFATSGVFTWNDSKGAVFDRRTYDPTDRVWQIRPARMGLDTILVFDSWTAYAHSVMSWKADELSTDLSEVEKVSREIYAGVGNKLTQTLLMIQRMPCHVVVIGHPDEYTKLEKPPGKVGNMKETDMRIQWTKMVPKSSSKPHSLTMAKSFSDVAWIDVGPTGKRKIDFKAASDRIIGGHFDDSMSVDERTLADVIAKIGCARPADARFDNWLTEYPAGEFTPAGGKPGIILGAAPASAPVAAAAAAPTVVPQVKLGGLMGLKGLVAKGVDK